MASLYNHREIEIDGKPLIRNKQFKSLCARIEIDAGAYEKAIQYFSFEAFQKQLITKIHSEKWNKQQNS